MSSTVKVQRADLLPVSRALSVVVVSLARFGSWSVDQDPAQAAATLAQLVEGMDICRRLAEARRVLDSYFDDSLGDDGMDDLERELQDENYWNAPS